jgi:hypothetical protein
MSADTAITSAIDRLTRNSPLPPPGHGESTEITLNHGLVFLGKLQSADALNNPG